MASFRRSFLTVAFALACGPQASTDRESRHDCSPACADDEVCAAEGCTAACIGEAGARCGEGLPDCAEGLFCVSNGSGVASFCTAPAALGEPCPGGRCVEPAMCDFWTARPARMCVTPPAVGEPCIAGVGCGPNEQCDFDPDDPTCIPLPADGEACPTGACLSGHDCVGESGGNVCRKLPENPGEPCLEGAWCGEGLGCIDGVCAEPPTEAGRPCVNSDCGGSLLCDYATNLCREPATDPGMPCVDYQCSNPDLACDQTAEPPTCKVPENRPGAPCTGYHCAEGLICHARDGGPSLCTTIPGVGETCVNGECVAGAYCDFGGSEPLCRALPGIGQPCSIYGTCTSDARCDDTGVTCIPRAADGEPCTGHTQCKSGHCPRGSCEPRPTRIGDPCPAGFCDGVLVCHNTVCVPADICG